MLKTALADVSEVERLQEAKEGPSGWEEEMENGQEPVRMEFDNWPDSA